jgi:NADH:ubiquinone oxidoreductase subunit D
VRRTSASVGAVAANGVGDFPTTNSASEPTAESRYLVRLEEMQAAARALRELLDLLVSRSDDARADLKAGQGAVQLVQTIGNEDGRAFRRQVHVAARHFERTMQALRGESFRIMIQDGNRSLTEVARTAGLSVQMVKRLVDSVG